jgi:hypothetical protein
MIVHAVAVDATRRLELARREVSPRRDALDDGRQHAARRQIRLKAITDTKTPYFLLDGKPLPCSSEAAVHFVAKLIDADGSRVSFSEWVQSHPDFVSEKSNRVLDSLPREIQDLIERGQGKSPRLRVELLSSHPGKGR